MKMRTIKLNPDFLIEALQGKTALFTSNFPDDVELLDMKYDLFSKQILAIIRSDSFEDIAESHPIPEFKVIYTRSAKSESEPVKSTKLESKPIENPYIQTTQNIRAVEKEFNPEHLELLSFTVDGDFIVVKPIQYLKAEWNEINAVVRSLGGKWIKGDIISYWAIPIR